MSEAAEIVTPRLRLIPLTMEQLRLYADEPDALERDLLLRLSRDNLDENARRAIGIKLDRMPYAPAADRPWLTYWLIVIHDQNFGAGLAGFKGAPNAAGESEIGYGIDPACRGQGYMTEAVGALVAWAFSHPACQVVTASHVREGNPASARVLEKTGFRMVGHHDALTDWRLERAAWAVIHMP